MLRGAAWCCVVLRGAAWCCAWVMLVLLVYCMYLLYIPHIKVYQLTHPSSMLGRRQGKGGQPGKPAAEGCGVLRQYWCAGSTMPMRFRANIGLDFLTDALILFVRQPHHVRYLHYTLFSSVSFLYSPFISTLRSHPTS